MSTVKIGSAAEHLACEWLASSGFEILDRNWRTRWCEIDIVAVRKGVIHFVEVKYRRRADFGSGFEAITFRKLDRMQRAALMWIQSRKGGSCPNYQLDAIEIVGAKKFDNLRYLPDVSNLDSY